MKLLAKIAATLTFALMVTTGCVPPNQTYGSTSPGYASATFQGTGVYVNGTELTAESKAQLDMIVGGSVPAGRYAMDAQYNFGVEGQAPVVNLAAAARERQAAPQQSTEVHAERGTSGTPTSMYSTDSAGRGSSLVSDGEGCMIFSTPDASLSSGC